jgi:alpha-beta hydrolase superfamily lysophospholipase
MVVRSEHTFDGSEGTVYYQRWLPDAPARRAVVIVHGYAEHGGRYAHVAEALADDDTATYAADHLGHGRSDGERALIVDFELVVDDLERLVERVAADLPGLPVVMVGHSMGGLLTARYVQRNPDRLAGAAFLGAVIGDWQWAREVLALPELPPADSNPDGMSRDVEACRGYAEDPLVYHGTYKRPLLEAEVVALDRFNAEIDRITVPVCFMHGTEDPFVPYGDSLDAVQRMPAASRDLHLYEGARHELVNETNRAEVLADLAAFVGRVAP